MEGNLVATVCDPVVSDRINSFSLVSYIPGRLGEFLTTLRQELVSSCVAQSHVTVLPPRPLFLQPQEAEEEIRFRVAAFAPVEIELIGVRIFDTTAVIFCDLGSGRDQLIEMHDTLNTGDFYFQEPYPFHPHITLAQNFPPELVHEMAENCRRRWQEFGPSRHFTADHLTFVQNTVANRWVDLADCELRGEAAFQPVG